MRSGAIGFLMLFCTAVMVTGQARGQGNGRAVIAGLDSIRTGLRIPGMSVAVMRGDTVLLEEGLGWADWQKREKVTPATTFRIASITKTFTSTLVMQLVEQGELDLRSPIGKYGLDLGNPGITVRNLLTHTSEEAPGSWFQYNGYRYGRLGPIMEKAAGVPFFQLLMEKIVQPLNMSSTAPGDSLSHYEGWLREHPSFIPFFERAHAHLARPYALDEKGDVVETQYLDEFGAFGGIATTAGDLLKYSAAIDSNRFVRARTQGQIFTANRTTGGELTPYGLGWFVQTYRGVSYYWHFGQTPGESGLFVKVPSRKLTLVVLTNTDKLSQPFPLGDGDLFMSPVGQLLYKYYINKDPGFFVMDYGLPVASIRKKLLSVRRSADMDFYNRELVVQASICIVHGDTVRARQFYELYGEINFNRGAGAPGGGGNAVAGGAGNAVARGAEDTVAGIQQARINEDLSKAFRLTQPMRLRVYGVGEDCSGDHGSWCDYGWIEDSTGKVVWQMQGQPVSPAGGAAKNQRVDAVIVLPAGDYKLRYKSDGGHAYDNWDSAPPDQFFWGILLFKLK